MKNGRMRFKYQGEWTQWFDLGHLPDLSGLLIDAVELQQELTLREYLELLESFD